MFPKQRWFAVRFINFSLAYISYTFYLFVLFNLRDDCQGELAAIGDIEKLSFPTAYHATGRLILPSSQVIEPFETWYSWPKRRSRIDFYNGTVKTFQQGDFGKYGAEFQIVPKFDYRTGKHYIGCWKRIGKNSSKIGIQSILPRRVYWPFKMNTSEFKFVGKERVRGFLCLKWVADIIRFDRKHVYTFYATMTTPAKPIRLIMIGYDVLLTSYYDNYTVEYDSFDEWKDNASVFEIPHVEKRDKWCWQIPKHPGTLGARLLNPIGDLLDDDQVFNDDWDHEFHRHVNVHDTSFFRHPDKEQRKRKHIFKHNVRYIEATNRQRRGSFSLHVNQFAHLTADEYNARRGLELEDDHAQYSNGDDDEFETHFEPDLYDKSAIDDEWQSWLNHQGNKSRNDAREKNTKLRHRQKAGTNRKATAEPLPREVDWRAIGAANPVQSQAICGSCWAFSTTAAAEASHFIKTGELVKLSEQELIDCSWYVPKSKDGNNGCLGGWAYKSMAFIKLRGLSTTASYGGYKGMESYCRNKNETKKVKIDSYMRVKPRSTEAMKRALARFGPVVTSMSTHHASVKFYKEGIYDDKHCGSSADHSVLVVGYGFDRGHLYWIIRNSWSENWGESGYIRIKNGRCGILSKPWVIITRNHTVFPWQ